MVDTAIRRERRLHTYSLGFIALQSIPRWRCRVAVKRERVVIVKAVWEFAAQCAAKCVEARHAGSVGSPTHANGESGCLEQDAETRRDALYGPGRQAFSRNMLGQRKRRRCAEASFICARQSYCPSPERLRAVGRLGSWRALSIMTVAAEAAPTGNVILRRSPERKCAIGAPPDRRSSGAMHNSAAASSRRRGGNDSARGIA